MDIAHRPCSNCILLISDNWFLLELVTTNLEAYAANTRLLRWSDGAMQPTWDARQVAATCRLVLLALSHSSNEPVVVLARAGLTHLVGMIPLLIISDRIFQADPERLIFHLPFPFSADMLRQQVADLLSQHVRPPSRGSPVTSRQQAAGLTQDGFSHSP